MTQPICNWFLLLVCVGSPVLAADADAMIRQLASDKMSERAEAIAGLRAMGDAAREPLLKCEATERLAPQTGLLVRRLLGQLLIDRGALPPIDRAGLQPFGEDAAKGRAGDPSLLFEKKSKLIALRGDFALDQGPLEFLVVTRGPNARLHETVLGIQPRPRDICWALLACAYTYAGELSAEGDVNLPKDAGIMLSVEFLWESPNAGMDAGTEIGAYIAAFREKAARLEKAAATQRADLLLDMESDVSILRNLIDHDVLDENTQALIVKTPFDDATRNEMCVHDPALLKQLLDGLNTFVSKQPALAAAVAKPVTLPEKKRVRLPIEFFAWNAQTRAPMKRAPFAFTGSKFEKDPNTKQMVFMADLEKSIVALKLDPYAILNTPLNTRSIDPQHEAGYSINRQITPRRGTRCWLVFEPWAGGTLGAAELQDTGDRNVPPAPPPAQ